MSPFFASFIFPLPSVFTMHVYRYVILNCVCIFNSKTHISGSHHIHFHLSLQVIYSKMCIMTTFLSNYCKTYTLVFHLVKFSYCYISAYSFRIFCISLLKNMGKHPLPWKSAETDLPLLLTENVYTNSGLF